MIEKNKIKVLGSGSSGNCYLIYDSKGQCLILEAGIGFKQLKIGLGFKFDNVVGCITSHIHSDHTDKRTTPALIRMGITVYSNKEVKDYYPQVKLAKKGRKIGDFTIYPFPLEHSAENFGYIIKFDEQKICFATDCTSIPYHFKEGKITQFLVEANYSDGCIINNYCDNKFGQSSFSNHHSLESCLGFLVNNFDGNCENICLIHLSDSNSDSKLFVDAVKDRLSFQNVTYAQKGLEIDLTNKF